MPPAVLSVATLLIDADFKSSPGVGALSPPRVVVVVDSLSVPMRLLSSLVFADVVVDVVCSVSVAALPRELNTRTCDRHSLRIIYKNDFFTYP